MSRSITIHGKEVPYLLSRQDKAVIDILYSSLTDEEERLLKAVSFVLIRALNRAVRRKLKPMELIYHIKEYCAIK